IVLYFANRQEKQSSVFSWALLGFFYLIVTLVYRLNSGIVDFSLYGRPVEVGPVLIAVPVGVVALITVFLTSQIGAPLRGVDVIAVEAHGARGGSFILLLALVAEVWIVSTVAVAALRVGVVIVGTVLLAACAMAWSGFRYYFTRQGLEIRTLGFRLRSIPL